MSIVALGDIHFRDDHPYFMEVCENFLEWYSSWERNNSNNSLILTGDLVESALLSGRVADYLERFIGASKFKSIHICCGNHDQRKYHNTDQLAYEFYRNKKNVYIYQRATETNIEGLSVLFLPFYFGLNEKGKSMVEYYNNIPNDPTFSNDYDLVVGHFSGGDMDFGGSSDCVSKISEIKTKKLILGHIHTRLVTPEVYIGSVFACKKNENDNTRCSFIYEDGLWKQETLPKFLEFLSVLYPNALPKSNALTPVYTILNCNSEEVALQRYGFINIKRVTLDLVENTASKKTDMERQFSSVKELNISELLASFFKSQDPPYDLDIEEECVNLLKMNK